MIAICLNLRLGNAILHFWDEPRQFSVCPEVNLLRHTLSGVSRTGSFDVETAGQKFGCGVWFSVYLTIYKTTVFIILNDVFFSPKAWFFVYLTTYERTVLYL